MRIGNNQVDKLLLDTSDISRQYLGEKLIYPYADGLVGIWTAKGKSNSDTDRGILKDLSGNGNDIQLNNFAYSCKSGYGGFVQNFNNWGLVSGTETILKTDSKVIYKPITQGWTFRVNSVPVNYNKDEEWSFILNKPDNIVINFLSYNLDETTTIIKSNLVSGMNTIPPFDTTNSATLVFSVSAIGDFEVSFEQVPLYENGLLFDGVDDFGQVVSNIKGIKSLILDFIPQSTSQNFYYDQRGGYTLQFGVLEANADSTGTPVPAYNGRNNGITYVDGVVNTTHSASALRNVRKMITIVNDDASVANSSRFILGRSVLENNYYAPMVFYRMAAYNKVLTVEEVIQRNEFLNTL